MKLVKTGKIAEARAMIEREKEESKYSATRVEQPKDGPARCYRGRIRVEIGPDGKWRPVIKLKVRKTQTACR
ncbi:MAG TPA: hypothetical protein VMF53_14400 [Alphaproteobacteria bacterium]|nr:hypothetical protein [Alphaproteobacteria bacterium]